MTPVHEAFLTLLRISLAGSGEPPELTGEQWTELFELAEAHKLLPMIFEAGFPRLRRTAPELAAAVKGRVRNHVILQTMRTEEFLNLYQVLTDAGLTPLVVKGIVCRQLYAKPDHRPSADEDVLIPPEQLSRCRQVLEAYGMATTESDPDAYEFPYRKAGSPLYIELHRSLFPPQSDAYGDWNRFFRDAFASAVELQTGSRKLLTLEPTTHMTYLLLHAFKHFLHSGFGIRQICDMLLFARHYEDQIQWSRVRKVCRQVRAEHFAAAVFAIGVKHLGFAPVGGWPEADEMPMLEDILRAGVYGSADETRLHSSRITLDAVSAQKQERRRSGALRSSAFPPAKALEGRYPWLRAHPYLLPAAWGHRIISYLRQPAAAPAEALRIGAERVELLRKYGIIP